MSLNMKSDLPLTHGSRLFRNRAKAIRECISWNDPDFIGMQEFRDFMAEDLSDISGRYVFYGAGRMKDHKDPRNERCCICWKKDRFELVEGSTFWLSHTPDVPGSKLHESIYPRIATLAILKDRKTGEVFTLCNTHLDHLLNVTRFRQAGILIEELEKRAQGSFLIVTGDFNATGASPAVRRILSEEHRYHIKDAVPITLGTTMHDFIASSAHRYRPIDHIFISDNVSIQKTEIISSLYMGVYPSDHCPVLVILDSPQH